MHTQMHTHTQICMHTLPQVGLCLLHAFKIGHYALEQCSIILLIIIILNLCSHVNHYALQIQQFISLILLILPCIEY